MSKPKRKRRGRIKYSTSAQLIHKNDKTRVARPDTFRLKRAPTIIPSNAATFKVKLRKK